MSLSPWDLGAEISFDFSLYRSRRDSYVYATESTQAGRGRRNPSYRRATKHPSTSTSVTSPTETASGDEDGDRLKVPQARKKRAHSYRAAVRQTNGEEELSTVDEGLVPPPPADDKCPEDSPAIVDDVQSPDVLPGTATPLIGRHRSTKNLLVLSVGFVFIFSAFRALQNLQTSVYQGRLGALVLTLVHGLALVTGVVGPLIVSRIGPRWSIALASLAYPLWVVSNLCVSGGVLFYLILLTSSGLVGVAQSIIWSAQV